MAKAERKSVRDLRNLCTLPENSAECLGSRRSAAGVTIYLSIYENTLKKLPHLPPKSCCNFTYLVVHGSMQSEHCSHIVKVGVEATS